MISSLGEVTGVLSAPFRLVRRDGLLSYIEERKRPAERDVLVWVEPNATWEDVAAGVHILIPVGERIREDVISGPRRVLIGREQFIERTTEVVSEWGDIPGMEDSRRDDIILEHRVTDRERVSGGRPVSKSNFVRHAAANGMRPDRVISGIRRQGGRITLMSRADYFWSNQDAMPNDELLLDRVIRTVYLTPEGRHPIATRRTTITITDHVGLKGDSLRAALVTPEPSFSTPVRKSRYDSAAREDAYRQWQGRTGGQSAALPGRITTARGPWLIWFAGMVMTACAMFAVYRWMRRRGVEVVR